MIIDRITVVVVESRNPIPMAKYSIHVADTLAMTIFFIIAVAASNLGSASLWNRKEMRAEI